MTIMDGSHLGFSRTSEYLRWIRNPDSLACEVVLANLEKSSDSMEVMSTQQVPGILPVVEMPPCPAELPATLNPLRQQQLTAMAVASFLEIHFGQTQAERDRALQFFMTELAEENPEVTVVAASTL